jgi:hypothetical protein
MSDTTMPVDGVLEILKLRSSRGTVLLVTSYNPTFEQDGPPWTLLEAIKNLEGRFVEKANRDDLDHSLWASWSRIVGVSVRTKYRVRRGTQMARCVRNWYPAEQDRETVYILGTATCGMSRIVACCTRHRSCSLQGRLCLNAGACVRSRDVRYCLRQLLMRSVRARLSSSNFRANPIVTRSPSSLVWPARQ